MLAAAMLVVAGLFAPSAASAHAPRYDRAAAVAFARKHWDDPARIRLAVLGVTLYQADDCSYFASEGLWAGGLMPTKSWTARTSDPKLRSSRLAFPGPSRTTMLADELRLFLVDSGQAQTTEAALSRASIRGAQPGDLVVYDWNHNGVMDHVSVVDSTGPGGTLIDQHNVNRHRQRWNYSSEKHEPIARAYAHPRAYLVHITR